MKLAHPALLLLFLLASCSKEQRQWSREQTLVLGHGGMGMASTWPMNSLEALVRSLELGADGVEVDLQYSSDGVFFLFHDERLEERTTAKGRIYEMHSEQIAQARYTNSFPQRQSKIARLEALFAVLQDYPKAQIFLDCKQYSPDESPAYIEAYNGRLRALIDSFGLQERTAIEYKKEPFLAEQKEQRPRYRFYVFQDYTLALYLAQKYHAEGIIINMRNSSAQQVQGAQNMGLRVLAVQAITRQENRLALDYGVDGIQTDQLRYLLRLLPNEN